MRTLSLIFLISILYCIPIQGQLSPTVDSIPMRDGKKLAADIYIPSSCTQCPTILIQTPYNRQLYRWSLPLNVGLNLNSSDYNFVIVDWRGFYGSANAATSSPNRGEDGYDVIDWIVNETWSDGQIGTWGPSALGKVQYETAREQHPNHTCAVPQVAAPGTYYKDFYYGGVLEESYLEQLDALGYGLSTIVLANPTYNITWNFAESSGQYANQIQIPMLMQGGWYDHNIERMLEWYGELQQQSPAAADIKFLIGPWVHGGSGAAYVGSAAQGELTYNNAAGWSDSLALDFFDYHMRNVNNGWNSFPSFKYYQMGENTWNDAANWPTNEVNSQQLWLYPNNALQQPGTVLPQDQTSYQYDPRDPSPTIGGPTLHPTLDQGPYDQAPSVESRNDIAIFTTATLTDTLVLKGSSKAHLFISSDRKDTDFVIRLTDVYPDGRSMLITDGIHRMRFRDGFSDSDTAVMTPGNIYEVEIQLPPTSYTFLPGHALRIDITSSNSRRWDTNLNNGGTMYTAGDTLIANNTVYMQGSTISYFEASMNDYFTSINELATNTPTLNTYPNPTNDQLTVEWQSTESGKWQLSLYDLHGKRILTEQKVLPVGRQRIRVDVSDIAAGFYFLQIKSRTKRATRKISIQP